MDHIILNTRIKQTAILIGMMPRIAAIRAKARKEMARNPQPKYKTPEAITDYLKKQNL